MAARDDGAKGRTSGNKAGAGFRRARAEAEEHVARHKALAPAIEARIVKALTHDGYLSEAAAKEAAFHLTDWLVDLEELNALFAKKRWSPASARRTLVAFVVHAPAHLAAAHRIMQGDPVTDVFELGAVKGTGRAKREPGGPYPSRRASQ